MFLAPISIVIEMGSRTGEGFAAFTTVPAAHHNQSSPQGSPLSDEAPAVTAPTPTTHP